MPILTIELCLISPTKIKHKSIPNKFEVKTTIKTKFRRDFGPRKHPLNASQQNSSIANSANKFNDVFNKDKFIMIKS